AEARLAAKRAARAEAREIRMKELERQQKELSDDEERMSGGSSVRGSSLHKKSKKKKKHKHKDRDVREESVNVSMNYQRRHQLVSFVCVVHREPAAMTSTACSPAGSVTV
ncbi:hypothetical protein XENORESO_019496, partial [Xenotaenia resolanae]